MDVIKKISTIHFACKMNETELSMCMVTKPWTCRFRLSILDCGRWVKHANVKCWMYSVYIASKTYGGLKSFQTDMSFESSLSFTYFLAFFCTLYKISHNVYGTNELFVSKWKKKLIFGIKKYIFNLILPNCSVILLNHPRNIIINSLPFNFSLEVKIYKRKVSLISINDPDYHKKIYLS